MQRWQGMSPADREKAHAAVRNVSRELPPEQKQACAKHGGR